MRAIREEHYELWRIDGTMEELAEFIDFIILGNFSYRKSRYGGTAREYEHLKALRMSVTFLYLYDEEMIAWRQYEKIND